MYWYYRWLFSACFFCVCVDKAPTSQISVCLILNDGWCRRNDRQHKQWHFFFRAVGPCFTCQALHSSDDWLKIMLFRWMGTLNRLLCPGIIDLFDPFGLKSGRFDMLAQIFSYLPAWQPMHHASDELMFIRIVLAFLGWLKSLPDVLNCWIFLTCRTGDDGQYQ